MAILLVLLNRAITMTIITGATMDGTMALADLPMVTTGIMEIVALAKMEDKAGGIMGPMTTTRHFILFHLASLFMFHSDNIS